MRQKGDFTLPGEAGHEALTLALAEKWGADAIRDSDGTQLSPELIQAGYDIYSTVCVIRGVNAFAQAHGNCLQQTLLCTPPVVQCGESLVIPLMDAFFAEQFDINEDADSRALWQVMDRTGQSCLDTSLWHYDPERRAVVISGKRWHRYTVSFFAYRLWEEISMYNHTTNGWNKEHLMQIDPIHDEAMAFMCSELDAWCTQHPHTRVVRFTSLFYNFVWIWGRDARNRHLFTDWSSYDFTVSPRAFALFEKEYGYALTPEDFINKGLRRSGHTVPNQRKLDWMAFMTDQVLKCGRALVDIVHKYGKKAYVFYDDSWVGMEPSGGRFAEFGFDGLIKCVFSGFEVRLCADAPAQTHEIRLHPYLFPVGLGGLPTFMPGGTPTLDAKRYWVQVRRALLRTPIDRIGLGGYLSLTEAFPDFQDYMAELSDEFRTLRDLHKAGAPAKLPLHVAVLTPWGKRRAWTLSGHFHETDAHDLIHVLESLSGMPLDVSFLSYDELSGGVPEDIHALIIAGARNTAWCGDTCFEGPAVSEALTAYVHGGGTLLGINEPSALAGSDTFLRLGTLLGVDVDDGRYACHGKWQFEVQKETLLPTEVPLPKRTDMRLLSPDTQVLCAHEGSPLFTRRSFGKGHAYYLSGYRYSPHGTRLLLNILCDAQGFGAQRLYIPDNPLTDCAYYEGEKTLAIVNLTDTQQTTRIPTYAGEVEVPLPSYGSVIRQC